MVKIKQEKSFSELIETRRNGNITDFKCAVRKMNKKTLLLFIVYLDDHGYDLSKFNFEHIFE